MIGKVLFTLGVILVVGLIWRTRRPSYPQARPPPRLINPAQSRRWPVKGLALAVGVLMLLASGYLLYDHWRDNNEVIYIRVVDASSGRAAEYRAQRGDIDEREFVTTDGRRVVLADTERLETSTIRSPGVLDRN
jgi:hypothetical protein